MSKPIGFDGRKCKSLATWHSVAVNERSTILEAKDGSYIGT